MQKSVDCTPPSPKSFCEVGYANFSQIFFATVRWYQWRFDLGWGWMHDAQ